MRPEWPSQSVLRQRVADDLLYQLFQGRVQLPDANLGLRRQGGVADRAAALAAGVAQLLWLWALPTDPPTAEIEARLSAPVLLGPSSPASTACGTRLLPLMINCLLRLRLPDSMFQNELSCVS